MGEWERTETSPDGRTRIEFAISTGRMSHEIYTPQIVDAATGQVLADFWPDTMWDGHVKWKEDGGFTLTMRYYAGETGSYPVEINAERDQFTFGAESGPLSELRRCLDRERKRRTQETEPSLFRRLFS